MLNSMQAIALGKPAGCPPQSGDAAGLRNFFSSAQQSIAILWNDSVWHIACEVYRLAVVRYGDMQHALTYRWGTRDQHEDRPCDEDGEVDGTTYLSHQVTCYAELMHLLPAALIPVKTWKAQHDLQSTLNICRG